MSTDQRSIDWYNKYADDYTAHVKNTNDSIYHSLYEKPAIYSLLPDLNGKKVISLGCGPGEDCNYLKNQGANKVVGVDISEKLIEIAKQNYPELEFMVMDMERLEFDDESFDLAFSSLAIHYIKDWTPVFKEVYRVLKPNSYFIFSCNHPVYNSMEKNQDDEKIKIQQLARIKHKDTDTVEIIGDYMTVKDMKEKGDLAVTTWHKPIGKMSEEIKKASFLIEEIKEPLPLKEMKQFSASNYETISKIPYFIIFKLFKRI